MELDESRDALLKREVRPGMQRLASASLALNAALSVVLVLSALSNRAGTAPARAEVELAAASLSSLEVAPVASPPAVTCSPSDADLCDCGGEPVGAHTWSAPGWWTPPLASIYEASAPLRGVPTPLARFRAKATIVTNVASA